MNARLVKPAAIDTGASRTGVARRDFLWSATAVGAFCGSAVAFIAGLAASAATTFGILMPSPLVARTTLAILLTAFLLAFLAAHALDKLGSRD